MRVLGCTVLTLAIVILVGSGRVNSATAAKEKTNAEKIVGVWEMTKVPKDVPKGSTAEFTKDGKVKMTFKIGDKTLEPQGTYKVEGDKLITTIKGPDGNEHTDTGTIKTLTNTTLVIRDSKTKEEAEFKRKK
jgi:uncharacterized protein (TIGR03066 family)